MFKKLFSSICNYTLALSKKATTISRATHDSKKSNIIDYGDVGSIKNDDESVTKGVTKIQENEAVGISIQISPLSKYSPQEIELLNFIFDSCNKNISKNSEFIRSSQVSDFMKVDIKYVRKLIHKIIKKGEVKITKLTNGKDPARAFILTEDLYWSLLKKRLLVSPKVSPSLARNSSSLYNNIKYNNININIPTRRYISTSAECEPGETLSPDAPSSSALDETETLSWSQIDISPLAEIGFTGRHVKQLKKITSPEIVQDSINHFAYGLKHNRSVKKYSDPLVVLMGVLRKGDAWTEKNYKSPDELAKKREQSRIKREEEKNKTYNENLIEQKLKIEFSNWQAWLTEDQLTQILPNTLPSGKLKKASTTSFLKNYYREKILIPQLRDEGLLK